jgi:Predicted pyridoxal phosphate-dependent enzyme apparently involved in regulation of cell wall biogenesis
MIKQLDLSEQYSKLNDEILPKIKKIFDTQQFVMGNVVSEFEDACATYLNVKHAIGVASGSDALLLSC